VKRVGRLARPGRAQPAHALAHPRSAAGSRVESYLGSHPLAEYGARIDRRPRIIQLMFVNGAFWQNEAKIFNLFKRCSEAAARSR
jgi:hypothetical protein